MPAVKAAELGQRTKSGLPRRPQFGIAAKGAMPQGPRAATFRRVCPPRMTVHARAIGGLAAPYLRHDRTSQTSDCGRSVNGRQLKSRSQPMFIGFYEPGAAKATNFSLDPSFRRSVNGLSSRVQEALRGNSSFTAADSCPGPRSLVSGADLVDDLEHGLLRGLCEPAVDALLHARHQDGVPKGLPAGL